MDTPRETPRNHALGAAAPARVWLGSGVLLFAALTAGSLLGLLEGWGGVLNALLWLCFALGGLGLVLGWPGARTLTRLAAAVTLVSAFLLPVSEAEKLYYYFTVWCVSGVPALAILVAAWLVKDSTRSDGKPSRREVATLAGAVAETPDESPRLRKRQRVAHVSFVVLGLIAAWAAYVGYRNRFDDLGAAFGFGVFIPFLLPLLVAGALGPLLSLSLWTDRRLVVSNGLTLALWIALQLLPMQRYWLALGLYAAACTLLNLAWFVRGQRRLG